MMNVSAWVAGFTAFHWVRLRGLLDLCFSLELEFMRETDQDSMTPWVLLGVTSRALLGLMDGV
jgi:hypothetical protein